VRLGSHEARRAQLESQLLQSIATNNANIAPLREQILALTAYLRRQYEQRRQLKVLAPISGYWTSANSEFHEGQAVNRGSRLGIITQPDEWRFIGVLPQVDTFIFNTPITDASLKIDGQAHHTLSATTPKIIPFDNGALPSRALGMAGGGDIAVDPTDPNGLTANEPFFRIETEITDPRSDTPQLMHGALAVMRLTLPDAPASTQIIRATQQFLQRRFRL
jgi:hypothetical protein